MEDLIERYDLSRMDLLTLGVINKKELCTLKILMYNTYYKINASEIYITNKTRFLLYLIKKFRPDLEAFTNNASIIEWSVPFEDYDRFLKQKIIVNKKEKFV